jgi:hypothetical protein
VPHPVRGETLNFGIVLLGESVHRCRFNHQTKSRLAAVAPDVNWRALDIFATDFAKRFGAPVEEVDSIPATEEALRSFASMSGSQVYFSDLRSYLSDEAPDVVLDELYREFIVVEPAPASRSFGVPKVRSTVGKAFRTWGIQHSRIEEQWPITGRYGQTRLDMAVVRADEGASKVVAALEPMSFGISSERSIVAQRDHIAWVKMECEGNELNGGVCAVVTEPPQTKTDLFQESMTLFERIGLPAFRTSELDSLKDFVSSRATALA